jgi:inosine/xanthosine triphosphatase
MRVGVGSGNPVKVAATERALTSERDGFGEGATVESCPVPSGVAEQPRSHREARRGARNRAEATLAEGNGVAKGYDLAVGIEGGVTDRYPVGSTPNDAIDPVADDALYLIMWAAVTDGETTGLGAGPSFPLPASIADRIRAGEELGPVMDDVLGQAGVATDQGASGAVTSGRVDRTAALSTAVAAALGPFVTDIYG